MSQIDDDYDSADARYENILRNTLLKRTGRNFKRNLDAAILPTQEKENHEDVAERIFDNILKRKSERNQTSEQDRAHAGNSETYGELLDDILWPGADEDQDLHQTLVENPDLNRRLSQAAGDQYGDDYGNDYGDDDADTIVSPAPANPSYQSILNKTLQANTKPGSQPVARRGGRGALRVEAAEPTLPTRAVPEPISHHYSAALDEILGLEDDPSFESQEEPSLSRTLYNQKLDQLLWPSEDKAPAAAELPPIDEGKLRSVLADYLQQLILPEPYGLIGVQRRVLDEKYSLYWIRESMHQLDQALQGLETDFTVWLLLQNIELLKRVISVDFIDRFRMVIEQMFPAQPKAGPFNQKKKDQGGGLFDRMNNNKFDDARRLIKANKASFTEEEHLQLFQFFKARLPEFLKTHQQLLKNVLIAQSEDAGGNPFVSAFLAAIFFSEPFATCFQTLEAHEDRYKQTYQNFLRDKCESMANKSDPLVPMILVAMDLFHEKAGFFRPNEREVLAQGLDLLEGLMKFLSEDYFNKEDLMQTFQSLVDTRVQAQFHVEGQALQSLGQEIGALAQSAETGARIRANHLNAIYERHNKDMSDNYHKRRDTLDKLNQGKGPSWTNRKQFIQRKLKACQQYLTRAPKRSQQPIEIPYRDYAPEFLAAKQKELSETQTWDNDYEKQILELGFEKANMVLKSLNQSKSTVKFNLKVLFNGEPTQERFLQAFAEVGQQLRNLQANYPKSETLGYVGAVLHRYLVGLRVPDHNQGEPFYDSTARIGYITAYLAHVSHIKLMMNLQFQQVIYDFQTLFDLVHALYLLDAVALQPTMGLGEHFRQMLIPSWYAMLRYCLMIGSGQYHFVSNPLALHDYSWQPQLSFGVNAFGDDDDDDFSTLTMDSDDADHVRFRARGQTVGPAAEEAPAPRFRAGGRRAPAISDYADDASDDYADEPPTAKPAQPEMPAMPSRRLLPSSPGKFEMYSAPTRRQPVQTNNLDDDDFYQVMGQTQESRASEPPALPPAQSPSRLQPARSHPDATPMGMIDLDAPEQPTSFARPRGLSDDDLAPPAPPRVSRPAPSPARRMPAAPEPPASDREATARRLQAAKAAAAESLTPTQQPGAKAAQPAPKPGGRGELSENQAQRKRWLEITPVPQERHDYDDMLDSILDSWEDSPSAQPAKEDSLSIVDQILRRNALDPGMQTNGNTSISHTVRRPIDDDY